MGLRNTDHERFCVLVGSGNRTEDEAWLEVFGKEDPDALVLLLQQPRIRERIGQVQDIRANALIERTLLSESFVLTELLELYQEAKKGRKIETARRILETVAKHPTLNLFPSRVEHHQAKDPLRDKAYEELLALAKKYKLVGAREITEEAPVEAEFDTIEDGPAH